MPKYYRQIAMPRKARQMIKPRKALDYIYPPRCPGCDRISPRGFCGSCKKTLVYIREDFCMKCGKPLLAEQDEYCADCRKRKHYFERGRALFSYQGCVRQSLYRLKYSNRREYAYVYGREMAEHLGSWVIRMGVTKIVPIPLHPSRRRTRGYNQAALIAREIGRQIGIPVDEGLLYRAKKTLPQKALTGAQRKENLAQAFCVKGSAPHGERILLVDDIYTTGHTADAAARCLKQSGDCLVFVLSAAIGG